MKGDKGRKGPLKYFAKKSGALNYNTTLIHLIGRAVLKNSSIKITEWRHSKLFLSGLV